MTIIRPLTFMIGNFVEKMAIGSGFLLLRSNASSVCAIAVTTDDALLSYISLLLPISHTNSKDALFNSLARPNRQVVIFVT